MPEGTRELRLVITAPDYDTALRFYRDVLGLREEASFADDNGGRATLLHAGRATIELADDLHAEAIDALEVGTRVAGPVRLAFEVGDAEQVTEALLAAGGRLVAAPVGTPWGSVNARLDGPDGQQLTVYSQQRHVGERPRLEGPVELAEPDPAWAETAEALVRDIRATLGSTALVVAHVGSTSVPGLAAKPVLDLVLGVPDPTDERAYEEPLRALGYRLRLREPEWHEHRLLRHDDPTVNLHVFAAGSSEVDRMLAFRDQLRRDAADRGLYERTKRELVSRTWAHVQDYADAKTDVVEEILRRAFARGPEPLRDALVVETGDGADLARDLARALDLPLMSVGTLRASLGAAASDAAATAALLAMAADARSALLHLPGQVQQRDAALPGRIVHASVARGLSTTGTPTDVARVVRQLAAS